MFCYGCTGCREYLEKLHAPCVKFRSWPNRLKDVNVEVVNPAGTILYQISRGRFEI